MSQKVFKPGDLVVCMEASESNKDLEYGRIYEVIRSNESFTYLKGFASSKGFYNTRFELYEKPKEEIKPTFKVGDIVEAFGVKGVVKSVSLGCTYQVQVILDKQYRHWFNLDGTFSDWHKTPSLVLISRPKKMVTKTIEAWANVYSDSPQIWTHSSLKEANDAAHKHRIACVKLTGTYETEVDDE